MVCRKGFELRRLRRLNGQCFKVILSGLILTILGALTFDYILNTNWTLFYITCVSQNNKKEIGRLI